MYFFLKPLAGSSLGALPGWCRGQWHPRALQEMLPVWAPRQTPRTGSLGSLPAAPLVPREPGWAPDAVPGRQRSQRESERVAQRAMWLEATRVPQTRDRPAQGPQRRPRVLQLPSPPSHTGHRAAVPHELHQRYKEENQHLLLVTSPNQPHTTAP